MARVLAEATEQLLILVVLVDLFALAASRLGALIRIVALQGIVLGIVPLLADPHALTARAVLLAGLSLGLKGFVFPILLFRATRDEAVRREVTPYVGYSLSMLVGAVLIGGSFVLGNRLPLPFPAISPLLVPVALSTALIGMFIIVSRRKAATQVLGYLVLENGIFVFGLTLSGKMPWLVEMGVLLDIFIGIFVMGIALHHIHRQFDSIDVDHLTNLRDVP
ncbi:MAG TPA: NADH-quinone oxidoreductase subunit K [Candidatus Polarisedimenticolaceae bacterium]|nr:NADH-quinone oxidoreductase subunit K [Candidatus Polarisedimenticolaceae bacterium]